MLMIMDWMLLECLIDKNQDVSVSDFLIVAFWAPCFYIRAELIILMHAVIQCSPLPAITNGFITYSPDNTPDFDLDTVATYSCGAGFVLDLSLGGTVTRTCLDDMDNDAEGLFNGQAPACIRK